MSIYRSQDGKTSFELRNTDFLDENGSKTYAFLCAIESHGFSANVDDIWFYEADLRSFVNSITEMIDDPLRETVILSAMSDFKCSVEPKDRLGHFLIRVSIQKPLYSNSALLTAEVESQSLANLLKEIQSTLC